MKLAGISDVGKVRENNEDNFVFGNLEQAAYCVVCDGMGGVEGGEIASEIAVQTIGEQIENAFSPKMSAVQIERLLLSAVTAANYKIFKYAAKNGLQGMGTTVVAVIAKEDYAVIANAGDSRVYLIGDTIRQLTTDHTYVNELFRIGELTEEERQTDPRKNIITRALGVSDEIEVDTAIEDFAPDAILLLCSDGLTNCLTDEQISDIVSTQAFENIPQALIDKANENGGKDNITAALILNKEA